MYAKTRFPPLLSFYFWITLLFSAILHFLVLSQIDWNIRISVIKDDIFEVDLVYPEKPKVVPRKKPIIVPQKPRIVVKPTRVKEIKPVPKMKPVPKVHAVSKDNRKAGSPGNMAPLQTARAPKPKLSLKSDLKKDIWKPENRQIVLGKKKLEIPRVNIPVKNLPELETLPQVKSTKPSIIARKKIGFSVPKIKDLEAVEAVTGNKKDNLPIGIGKAKDSIRFKIVDNSVAPTSKKDVSKSSLTQNPFMEGEVRQRKLIFKPKPPSLNIESDVTITLSFTVLPNGTVDQIFPERKAEPALEQLAIRLLQQYRFEPLFENEAVQKGKIHFTIRRKK